jgi:hypothetical protein
MPVELVSLHGGTGVLFACSGVVTARDLMNANERLLAAADQSARYKFGLVDLLGADSLDLSIDEIRLIAEQDTLIAAIAPKGTIVAVVAGKDLAFGLARMWEAFAGDTQWETKTFRSRSHAESWIRDRVKDKFGLDLKDTPGTGP